MRSLFLISLLLCLPDPALAVETRSLPSAAPQAPARTNMTEAWRASGAARLYWGALVSPRQVQTGGASFRDPASVPELPLNAPSAPQKAVSRKKAKSPATAALQQAPAGAGSTTLAAPAAGQKIH
ncbi:MAG: hypothetical protein LBQ10_02240 [Desulfovibrio sp.]|jgi:hypothetical protein|nr:hypothetical protein [Desulfovibrio sp.]